MITIDQLKQNGKRCVSVYAKKISYEIQDNITNIFLAS